MKYVFKEKCWHYYRNNWQLIIDVSIVVECSPSCELRPQSGPTKDLKMVQTESLPSTLHFREKVWEGETAGVCLITGSTPAKANCLPRVVRVWHYTLSQTLNVAVSSCGVIPEWLLILLIWQCYWWVCSNQILYIYDFISKYCSHFNQQTPLRAKTFVW